jgi:hypothetical protein
VGVLDKGAGDFADLRRIWASRVLRDYLTLAGD